MKNLRCFLGILIAGTQNNMPDYNEEKLAELLQWLDQDPENSSLLTDTVDAAIAADAFGKATQLLADYSEKNELSPEMLNLSGILALRQQDIQGAVSIFSKLIEAGNDDPATRFNLAWSHALLDEYEKCLALIDDVMARDLPQAAALKIHMMHSNGQFDEAIEEAKFLAEIHPNHPGLMAAISVLALDVEDTDMARLCAEKAGAHPDALATLGTLDLGENNLKSAQQKFQESLLLNDSNARAWVGQGLAKLSAGSSDAALGDLDKGAEIFGTHIGSWIASGWAYFIADDIEAARNRFQKAYDLDANFAESHGSLAVIDVIEGKFENARNRCELALRLDKQCFSAALAKVLLLQAEGSGKKAEKFFKLALNMPINDSGQTLADNLVRVGSTLPNRQNTIH